MAAVVAMFGSNDGMRRVRERRLVGPAHNHDEEQHHLQQHLLPASGPNAHSAIGLRWLGFKDFYFFTFLFLGKFLGFYTFDRFQDCTVSVFVAFEDSKVL
jgi:hypothetical protein